VKTSAKSGGTKRARLQKGATSRGATPEGTSAPRRRDARENYERILRVAADVFAEHGLGATLADIARKADVGIGTMYRCFPNKDDLILELFAQRFAEVEREALEASQAKDPWDGFVRHFEASTRALAADRGFREFVMGGYTESLGWARGSAPDRIIALVQRTEAAVRGHMTNLVRRAKKAGALRTDVQPSDMLVLTIAIQSTVEFGGAEHPDLHRRIIGIMLDGLRVSRSAPSPLPVDALTDEQLASMRGPRGKKR
jgi:AcrR family transcriptional regulator